MSEDDWKMIKAGLCRLAMARWDESKALASTDKARAAEAMQEHERALMLSNRVQRNYISMPVKWSAGSGNLPRP